MATHIALHEVSAEFDPRPISLARNENRSHEYLALNPEGKVPTLVADGRAITEVAATLYYVARKFPSARLLQGGVEDETAAISWMSFLASTVHPARKESKKASMAVWNIVEHRIGSGPWALGSRFSIVDIHLFRLFWRFKNLGKLDAKSLPQLSRHFEQMLVRPAVQKTMAIESAIGYDLRDW